MHTVRHKITHHYQPSNRSCGYAALAMLLSHYGVDKRPAELEAAIIPNDETDYGSITPEVATWCRSLEFDVHLYSFDFQITDFSWIGMPKDKILERLHAVKHVRNIPVLGKRDSARYVQAYIDLLESGAKLTIAPHVTTKLLYELLQTGPVYANACPRVLHGTGRKRAVGLRKTVDDDLHGGVGTHSLVIYGNDEHGNFLIVDPWEGLYVSESETVICAITAAELECDSQIFQISRPA